MRSPAERTVVFGKEGIMLRVRDIMTTDLLVLEPEMSIRDAMASLSTRHVSGAPVVAGEKVVGVVTASDLVDFASALPGVPTARDEVEPADEVVADAERAEGEERVEGEVEGENPPGAFFHEMWSDSGADVTERMNAVAGPEWDVLGEHVVSEAMNRMLCALPPDAPVDQAADYMRGANIHRVLVMNGEKLVGIVSASDIVSAVADHKLTSRTWVFDKPPVVDVPGRVGVTGKVTTPAGSSPEEGKGVDANLNQGRRPDDTRR